MSLFARKQKLPHEGKSPARFAFVGLVASVVIICLGAPVAQAAEADASGTIVKRDAFNTQTEWGTQLVLPREGKITRVMDGTYGFDIKTPAGVQVASFLDPQDAVGTSLPAGTYVIVPYVCKLHRHHHIEISATY